MFYDAARGRAEAGAGGVGMARPTKLNKALQTKLVKLLKTGATVADACQHVGLAESTFYDWQAKGDAGDSEFLEFSEAVNRARNDAKVSAIDTLRTAMSPYRETSTTTETFTETRLDRKGAPYEYTRQTERKTVTLMAGDWRAAVEYLKRRYPDEWSEKRILELGLTPELLKRLDEVAKQADVPASELFENMLNALANRLSVTKLTSGE